MKLTELAVISQNSSVVMCHGAAHSPITEGNTAAPVEGSRVLSIPSDRPFLMNPSHLNPSLLH